MTYLDLAMTAAPAVGFVSVFTTPAVEFVYIDGAYRGITPLTVAATVGSRRIELDHQDHADWTTTARVMGGSTIQVDAYLQPLPASSTGGITVASDPAGAAVSLAGQFRGLATAAGEPDAVGHARTRGPSRPLAPSRQVPCCGAADGDKYLCHGTPSKPQINRQQR